MSHATLAVFGLICIFAIFNVNANPSFADLSPLIQQYTTKCCEKTDIPLEKIDEYMKLGSLKTAPQEFLCFLKCFVEEAGAVTGKKVDVDKMWALMKEADEPVTDECKKEVETTEMIGECEDILKIRTCMETRMAKMAQ